MDRLKHILPSGSGIDYEWEVTELHSDSIVAKNGWHYMNQNGYYLGCIDFTTKIYSDGIFDRPEMPNPEQFAHTELARDIAICYYEKDDVTYNEIVDAIWSELECISDVIYSSFESVNSNELADAVKDYINESCKVSYELPGFWGFYCSDYTENTDLEYFFFNDYDSLDKKTKNLYKEFMDRRADYSFDSDYINNVCKIYVEKFDDIMRDIIPDWENSEYEFCQMPKYYNFESDRCFAKTVLTDDVVREIQDYLDKNRDLFEEYIKSRFTSRDGFYSNYSNDINDWKIPLRNMDYNELGAVLYFILINENVDYNYINCQVIEQLRNNGEDYDFYIVNKNQNALYDYIRENGGTIEE